MNSIRDLSHRSHAWRTAACALALMGSAPALAAHSAPAPSAATARHTGGSGGGSGSPNFATQVRFANRTSYQRVEWGLATVPFPEGVFQPGDSFGVGGLPCELIPFGSTWPDGSIRFAQLAVPLDLNPGEEQVVDLQRLSPVPYQFNSSGWVASALPRFKVKLIVVLPNAQLQVIEPSLFQVEADTEIRKSYHLRGRIPQTDLICDLWYSEFSGQDHMPFELRLTSSNAASRSFTQYIESAHLWVEGAAAHVRASKRRGARYGPVSEDGPNVVHLLGPTTFWDGQGQEWIGDFMFHHPDGVPDPVRSSTIMATIQQPLFGVSLDWASSGGFGPFGHVPDAPAWITDGGRSAAISRRQAFDSWIRTWGDPWEDWPLGMSKFPGMTGLQPDFGAARLVHIFASGMPDGIEEGRLNASEEAARPVHHREADGTMVRVRNHPNWVAWDGRTHWHSGVSPDRLGKPSPEPSMQTQGWKGRDTQHWSSLTLASAYLLTASPSLRYELDNEAELYMAVHTLPSMKPGHSTNIETAPRAVGRTSLSMAWNYMLTGNDDLRSWMGERLRQSIYPNTLGLGVNGPVQPLLLTGPDPRQLMRDNWKPWEEAQAAMGLEAVYRTMEFTEAHSLAYMIAKTTMEYGWKTDPNDTIVGTAIGWKSNGALLSATELNDPSWVLWSYGTGFNEWSVPQVKLALRFGQMYGDTALTNLAQTVLQRLEAARVRPGNGGWDSYAGWDAVN